MTTSIDRLLNAATAANGIDAELFAPDAVLDATVPGWRLWRHGPVAISAQLSEWFKDAGTFDELHRQTLPAGELVEFTLTWEEGGVPHAAHQAWVFELDRTGRIETARMWCGGRWPAGLLAEMEAARVAG